MASGNAKKSSQINILAEIRRQLIHQAARWGRTDFYNPVKLEEYELESCEKIRSQFLAEKNNLEYELHMLTSDKKELLIKLERLGSYIQKAERVINKHHKNLDRLFERKYGEAYKTLRALRTMGIGNKFSLVSKG